ncbi:MAG: phosphoribosylformylglycinamidine synthase [Betaproteobacteria bacterium]|nr:phosphoribosylformylglycinamidine synthase [Betaproteobacteria bacterium]
MNTPVVASPGTPTLLTLPGPEAVSPFRLEKMLRSLRETQPAIQHVSTAFMHFVQCAQPLTSDERQVLDKLLTYGRASSIGRLGEQFLVIPRIGTISPWASKATNIAHNCGLAAIRRIERGTVYCIEADGELTAAAREAVLQAIHDPMTETVQAIADGGAALFVDQPPAHMAFVAVMANGKSALEKANVEMGLAMSPDEVDYLFEYYHRIQRDPTDAELMMFAQANSEHCRHKIFNASWTIDGQTRDKSLFGMIRNTHQLAPQGTVVAYSDNSAVMEGAEVDRFFPANDGRFAFHRDETHILMKVETHNHPTAIAPWPGAATGSGGEIRDEGATGIGAKPKAGLTGFSVSNLNIPGHIQPWESGYGKPARIASALSIMIEGPIGGAAFNNEFGRINLNGYFRTYEQLSGAAVRGYHKPIMIAGGLGNISAAHTHKKSLAPGTLFIQLGGPGMRIGLGGGAASSMTSGSNTEALDFDSVQRANAEMERRCQEVIDRCWQMRDGNLILSIHDVGAGGISNALPELAHGGGVGARFDLRAVPSEEPGMSPREIWSNESQERYVLAIAPESLTQFRAICERERCPFAVLGTATAEQQLVVADPLFGNQPVNMEMEVLLGKPPRMHRDVATLPVDLPALDTSSMALKDAVYRVLRLPTVADKSFLITIGDRSVGGLTVRDQFVGPWQVPVADCAVTLMGYDTLQGEAMAMGERTPLAIIDSPASGRMAVGEAITNISSADIDAISDIKLSANWMAAAGYPGEDARLYETVKAVGMELCPALGISIPVGKDSLSMKTVWNDDGAKKEVVAPVSLIISAFARVADAGRTLTPQLDATIAAAESELLLIDLGQGRNRLGGSALAQVYAQVGNVAPDVDDAGSLRAFFAAVRKLSRDGKILAYHDRSDGGLLATLVEMMFASHKGVTIYLDTLTYAEREADIDDYDVTAGTRKLGENDAVLAALFNEELGAVLQIRKSERTQVMQVLRDAGLSACSHIIGHPNEHDELRFIRATHSLLAEKRVDLQRAWSETSYLIQAMRDNPATAKQEYDRLLVARDPGLNARLTFDAAEDIAAPFIAKGVQPKIAILREQGVNGQLEMAHAFTRAGFDAYDVHMSDIIAGRISLADFKGFAACGGFSYGDVLGAGEGWAKSVLFNARARDEFETFFKRSDSFALGVCNGCQMMSNLHEIIPGAENWPHLERNASEQYEARTVLVEIRESPSILFAGMAGSRLPVATAHGEGQAVFRDRAQQDAARWLCAASYVDNAGKETEQFPANPNGSPLGMTAFTTPDGRFTIMMPHPERVALNLNLSWHPADWPNSANGKPAFSPWLRLFRNARRWVA